MSSLAFDKQAKPLTFHKRTKQLRVRLFRNPRARGTCSQVLDEDGEPLYIDVDTDYAEFRQIIGNVPGLYRLDQCDDDGNELEEQPAAYVMIDPPRNAQAHDVASGEVSALTIIREMAAIQGEALKALSQHQAQILASTAEVMRAPYRPAPPPAPAELRNAADDAADDDDDDYDDEHDADLESDPDDEGEVSASLGGLGWLVQLSKAIDMKVLREFSGWAMTKYVEFRKETAAASATTVAASTPVNAPATAPASVAYAPPAFTTGPVVAAGVAAAPVASVAQVVTASVNATQAPAMSIASASTDGVVVASAPSSVTSAELVSSSASAGTQGADMPAASVEGGTTPSIEEPGEIPPLTEEQTLHVFAINARLTDQERAIAEQVIMRMGQEKMRRWAIELSAMSLDDATATVRGLIAEMQQKRRPKPAKPQKS